MAKKTLEDNAREMLEEYENENPSDALGKVPQEIQDAIKKGTKIQTFLTTKKRKFKETKYRRKYDSILGYMDENLINTETYQAAMKSQATNVAYSYVYENGSYTQIPVLARNNANDAGFRIPKSKEPIAYAKLMTAVSVLGAKVPDGTFKAADKIYARAQYELWKDTWANSLGNGLNTLRNLYQNVLGSGFGAYRIYPKKISHMSRGQERILFEGVYRQALDTSRVWVGNSVNIYDRWSWGEVVYEIDHNYKEFLEKHPDAKYYQLEFAATVQESKIDGSVSMDYVTIRYYEDPLKNKYCAACGNFVLYEGEIPNDDGFGHVIWTNCFVRNPSDPYGVGLVEIMRGNTEMYDYIMSLSAEQVEAEISPLLFGTNTGVGEMTYRRGPNVVNPKVAGTEIDVIKTSGNVQQSLLFTDKQKQIIAENTGINDILAGQAGEGTLGATVILKEAALNRLIIPRNNVVSCLELDAYITLSWIKQTYTAEKVMKFESSEELSTFMQLNPNYFLQEIEREYHPQAEGESENYESDTSPITKSITYAVSKKVPLNFNVDFHESDPSKDEIQEMNETYQLPATVLFDILQSRGHTSDNIIIVIDGSSMLLPSEEINKQRMTEIFTIINPMIMQIVGGMSQQPALSRALLKSTERILEVNKESVFDWIPKDIYDQVMSAQGQPQPSVTDIANQVPPGTTDRGGNIPSPTPNDLSNPIGKMTQDFKSNFNTEIVNPMKGAMNASVKRAAKA